MASTALRLGAGVLTALCLFSARSAIAAPIPPGVEPGVLDRSFQSKPTISEGDVVIPSPDAPDAPGNAKSLSLTLTSIEVTGSTVFSSSELTSLYADLIGRKVDLAQVYARTAAITEKYASAGYALCIAFLPPQRIQNGKLKVEVVEGYVSDVRYTGAAAALSDSSKGFFENLTRSRPLRAEDLERYLLLANDVPGLRVRSMFEKSEAGRGATRLIVETDHAPIAASVEVSNRGSRAVGREQVQAEVALNSVLGLGEKLSIFGAQAFQFEELSYVQGRASFPLGSEGLRIHASGSYSESDPGTADLDALNFISNGYTGELGIQYPLIRSRTENLTLGATFAGKQLQSDLLGTTNSRDRLFIASLSAAYSHRGRDGQSQATLTLYQGLDVFNATTSASVDKSRDGGSGVFSSITLDLSHEQVLAPGVSAFLALSVQAASRGLLASEECGYGAEPFGRGFDPSEIAGDHCLKGLVELRAAPFVLLNTPNALGHLSRSLAVHAFADAGIVQQEGALFPGEVREESGQSIGGGIRFEVIPEIAASVEYAHPLSRDVALEKNRDGRVFFSLRTTY